MAKKNPVGRPSEYRQEYCQMLIDHMSQGYSVESFAGIAGVSKQTIYTWFNKHPEFLDAKEKGEAKSRLHWEKLGMEGMWNEYQGATFNSTMWIFNMKCRFRWKDRSAEDSEGGTSITLSYKPNDS